MYGPLRAVEGRNGDAGAWNAPHVVSGVIESKEHLRRHERALTRTPQLEQSGRISERQRDVLGEFQLPSIGCGVGLLHAAEVERTAFARKQPLAQAARFPETPEFWTL